MKITKSFYVTYTECPILAWHNLFNPLPDTSDKSRAEEGQRVGVFARDYFKNWKMFDSKKPQTLPGVFVEYVFKYQDLECRVDILVINEDNSIDIYEVKSVNDINKKKFLEDISFQYYVVEKASKNMGFTVKSANLMSFNPDYIYDGKSYDYKKLFKVTDKTNEAIDRVNVVEENLNSIRSLSPKIRPNFPLCAKCKEENTLCRYLDRCKAHFGLPDKHSVFELNSYTKKMDLISMGILTWDDLIKKNIELSDFNKTMLDCYDKKINTAVVKKAELQEYLGKVQYPVYFFDFESVAETIPVYANSKPYEQITFQYSLHISNSVNDDESAILRNHREFLGDGINDPREDLIKQMISDLGTKGTIFAYHDDYEKSRIKELINDFPQYKDKLEPLLERFMDLEEVFKYHPDDQIRIKLVTRGKNKGQVKKEFEGPALTTIYHPKMETSSSIKKVLPAFFEGRDDLDYHKLNQVHKGDEAMLAYKKLKTLTGKERDELRANMLKYCCLDTKAMVVLYLKYIELANN